MQQRFYKQFERSFYMKIIATIIPTDLVTNFFYTLVVLSYKPKTRIWFSASWWSGNEKYFCFLFISSRTLLQNHGEFNRLLQMNFFTCYSCLYCSSMFISISCSSQNVKRYPGQRICFSKDSDIPIKEETPVCMCS